MGKLVEINKFVAINPDHVIAVKKITKDRKPTPEELEKDPKISNVTETRVIVATTEQSFDSTGTGGSIWEFSDYSFEGTLALLRGELDAKADNVQ